MKRKTLLSLTVFLLCLCISAAQAKTPKPSTISLTLGKENFILEKAETVFAKKQGLMHRKQLAKNKGMIFIYDYPIKAAFWMGYTKIPLDLIMIDPAGIITDIFRLDVQKPRGENESLKQYQSRMPRYESSRKILYAVEVNQGTAESLGIKKGDRITIPENI